jgi:hypothetical protein
LYVFFTLTYVLYVPPIPSLTDRLTKIWWRVKYGLSLCGLLQIHASSSLLDPNILLSTLFSNTLNLCSSLSVRGKVSHPHKNQTKYVIYAYSTKAFPDFKLNQLEHDCRN